MKGGEHSLLRRVLVLFIRILAKAQLLFLRGEELQRNLFRMIEEDVVADYLRRKTELLESREHVLGELLLGRGAGDVRFLGESGEPLARRRRCHGVEEDLLSL